MTRRWTRMDVAKVSCLIGMLAGLCLLTACGDSGGGDDEQVDGGLGCYGCICSFSVDSIDDCTKCIEVQDLSQANLSEAEFCGAIPSICLSSCSCPDNMGDEDVEIVTDSCDETCENQCKPDKFACIEECGTNTDCQTLCSQQYQQCYQTCYGACSTEE